MGRAERLECQRRWQLAGVPDFQAIGKKHDLHGGVGGVVAVRDGVNNGFGDSQARQFIGDRSLVLLTQNPSVGLNYLLYASRFKRISSTFRLASKTVNTYTSFSEIRYIILQGGITISLYIRMP